MVRPAVLTRYEQREKGNQPVRDDLGRHAAKHIALFMNSLAVGGVERVMLNLADALVKRGHQVDLVLCRVEGPYLGQVPASVKVVALKAGLCSVGGLQPRWDVAAARLAGVQACAGAAISPRPCAVSTA